MYVMRFLIDTQIFLWFVAGSSDLKENIKILLEDENNEIYLSIASLWEISIKTALGKLAIAGDYETVIDDVVENGMEILNINFAHTVEQNKLDFHHKDPFDRLIAAQAIVERVNLISSDEIFDSYFIGKSVKRIW